MTKRKWMLTAVLIVVIAGLGVRKSIGVLKDGAAAYLYGYSLVLMETTK